MAPSKIRKALGAVKDKTSIGLAKAGSNSVSNLDVAIIKATRHGDNPASERHIREVLALSSYSQANVSACVNAISRRLNKTRNWTVALKTLILIHRLLSEGDPAHELEIFNATRRGTRLLNMSDFRDASQSGSWDFSAFVRTFALYLDERLEFRMHGRRYQKRAETNGDDEREGVANNRRATPVRNMKIQGIFTRSQHLLQLLERFLACRPTGAAKSNRIVILALYPLIKESFQIYYDIVEIMGILVDRFMELDISDCIKVLDIFSRISKQFDDLDAFYTWCKSIGIAKSSEYPEVEKITSKKLEVMDEFIRDKSVLAHSRMASRKEEPNVVIQEPKVELPEEDDDPSIKALPALEEQSIVEIAQEEEEKKEAEEEKRNNTQEEADFLNLREDAVTVEEQGDKLALALFAGETAPAVPPEWVAFTDEEEPADWETALVLSASNLSSQKAALGGGFDMLMLDGMYNQGSATTATAAGSASSVAFIDRSHGLLALPAPSVSGNSGDPFAASLTVAPPSYVQMQNMEVKQQLLVEEQLMWQQYARDGMQGQAGMAKLQMKPYYCTQEYMS